MLIQFSTNGQTQREVSCESFDLLLQMLHQVLMLQKSSLSLELGVIDGQVVQSFRTEDQHSLRSLKNALTNVFPTCRLTNLPDHSFVPLGEASTYLADVNLKNDLYAIRRWQQMLTQADPLTILLGALSVNKYSRCTGHVSITIAPLADHKRRHQENAFTYLQHPFFDHRQWFQHIYEKSARNETRWKRLPAWFIQRAFLVKSNSVDLSMAVGSTRYHERETDVQAAANKLSSACFRTSIRIRVFAPRDKQHLAESMIHQIYAPFAQFNAPRLGQFQLGTMVSTESRPGPSFLLSCEELSSIFHPPVAKTERLAISRFVSLEPPKELPISEANTMKMGRVCFHRNRDQFGLYDHDAALHGFVVGSSGSGKTTLLTTAIMSLIKRGQGITLVDFHGDFANSIKAMVPAHQNHRVVSFSPLDQTPVPFNPLSCPDKTKWPIVADSVLSGIRNLFGNSWGPRLEQILQMALSATIAAGDTTLLDVRRMLTDEPLRVKILSRVDDPVVREFWFQTYSNWDKRYRTEAIQSVINKLDALLTPKLRAMFCQSGKSFDFRQAFDDQKIIIVNLARGQMGQTAASTLGSLVLSAIQNAALSRADCHESERIPHSVFLDELQLYSDPAALTSLLAEARKYRVAVWSATQSLASIDQLDVLPIVLSNAANLISFRVSQKDAVEIAPMLDDYVRPQDLVSLPRFHAYARIMINGEVQPPFSLTTIAKQSG